MVHVREAIRQHSQFRWRDGATSRALDLQLTGHGFEYYSGKKLHNNLGQVVHTYVPLSPRSITWYWPRGGHAVRLGRKPQAWWKEMATYCRVDDLWMTCGLTACTPGSAPGPTLGNEYGKPLPFFTASLYFILCGTHKQ